MTAIEKLRQALKDNSVSYVETRTPVWVRLGSSKVTSYHTEESSNLKKLYEAKKAAGLTVDYTTSNLHGNTYWVKEPGRAITFDNHKDKRVEFKADGTFLRYWPYSNNTSWSPNTRKATQENISMLFEFISLQNPQRVLERLQKSLAKNIEHLNELHDALAMHNKSVQDAIKRAADIIRASNGDAEAAAKAIVGDVKFTRDHEITNQEIKISDLHSQIEKHKKTFKMS